MNKYTRNNPPQVDHTFFTPEDRRNWARRETVRLFVIVIVVSLILAVALFIAHNIYAHSYSVCNTTHLVADCEVLL